MADYQIPRMTPAEIVEELRDEAAELAPALEGIPAEETVYGQAAQMIEEMGEALTQIAAGAADPKGIAQAMLDVQAPLKAPSDPLDSLKRFLKPRTI